MSCESEKGINVGGLEEGKKEEDSLRLTLMKEIHQLLPMKRKCGKSNLVKLFV